VISGSCKEDAGEPKLPSIYLGWVLESGGDLFTERADLYEPFMISVIELEPFRDTITIFHTKTFNGVLSVLVNGDLPTFCAIDFGNGDVDTLQMVGNAGTYGKEIYEQSTKIDFYYNEVLQVTWDVEKQVATYHYLSGRQERLPMEGVIENPLLILKDSASMADIGFK
jgi:hypothetical protein